MSEDYLSKDNAHNNYSWCATMTSKEIAYQIITELVQRFEEQKPSYKNRIIMQRLSAEI